MGDDDSTGDLLMAVARRMRRSFMSALADDDVTPAQSRALRIVVELESARISAVAEGLHIAPRSATEVVDALESRGLVERHPDPADRRATFVVATDEGRRLRTRLERTRRTAADELLADLPAADRAELDRILRLLAD